MPGPASECKEPLALAPPTPLTQMQKRAAERKITKSLWGLKEPVLQRPPRGTRPPSLPPVPLRVVEFTVKFKVKFAVKGMWEGPWRGRRRAV